MNCIIFFSKHSACTAERFFRIDKAQEQLHYVTDVAVEAVYILQESSTHQETGHKSQSATNSQRLARFA